jgi:hypothetical protein
MANLSQAQRIQIEEMFTQPRFEQELEFRRVNAYTNTMMQGMQLYNQVMVNAMGEGVDPEAAQRAIDYANSTFAPIQDLAPWYLQGDNWEFDFGDFTPGG